MADLNNTPRIRARRIIRLSPTTAKSLAEITSIQRRCVPMGRHTTVEAIAELAIRELAEKVADPASITLWEKRGKLEGICEELNIPNKVV